MWTGLTLVMFAIGGVLMMNSVGLGLLCWAAGVAAYKRATVRDEESFIELVMTLAGAGAIAIVLQDLYQRFIGPP